MMNYTSLVAQIQSYANRNEPAFMAAIPNLITAAMNRIYSEVESIGFQTSATGNMVIGTNTILKPTDFKKPLSLLYTTLGPSPTVYFLEQRSLEICLAYSPMVGAVGAPVFYSTDLNVPALNVGNSTIYLSPTPDMAYPYVLNYLSFPVIFNTQNPTNFLTDRYENLLIYACMVEAIPYLKSDERIPVFESLYNRAVQGANKDNKGRYSDRTIQRDKD